MDAVISILAQCVGGCEAMDVSQLAAHKPACLCTWLILAVCTCTWLKLDYACSVAEAVVRAIGSRWPVRLGLLPIVPEALLKSTQQGTQSTEVSSNISAVFL